MRMPWQAPAPYEADPQVRLEPREVGTALDFEPKPAELVRAESAEWTRPRGAAVVPRGAGPLPWTDQPPKQPGVYWWATATTNEVRQCKVVEYGGRMCVQVRGGDGSTFLSVEILGRWWAGPTPLPEHVELEQVVLG